MHLKHFLIVLLIGLASTSSYGQGADPDLMSPKNAIETHLIYLQDDSYNPKQSAKVIPESVGQI